MALTFTPLFAIAIVLFLGVWPSEVQGQSVQQAPTSAAQIQLNIGFIGASELEVIGFRQAYQDILTTNSIDPRLNFTFVLSSNCSDFAGVTLAAEMHYRANVSALIGPGCATGLECVSRLAASWKIPQVLYTTSTGSMSDKSRFSTLSNVSPTGANSFCEAILSILKANGWQRIALVYNVQKPDLMVRISYIQRRFAESSELQLRNVELNGVNESDFTGQELYKFSKIRDFTRVIIVLMGTDIGDSRAVLQVMKRQGISSAQYVIFLPWLERAPNEHLPWVTINASTKERHLNQPLFDDFVGCIIMDGSRDSTNTTTRYYSNLLALNVSGISEHTSSLPSLFALYDALKLYILAVNVVLITYGPEAVYNGSLVFETTKDVYFEGASGLVQMNSNGDRIPYDEAFDVSINTSMALTPILSIFPYRLANCNESELVDCYMRNFTVLKQADWEKFVQLGREPACGYDGLLCSGRALWWWIFAAAICVSVLLILAVVYVWRRDKRITNRKVTTRLPWLIPISQVQFITKDNKDQLKSSACDASITTLQENKSDSKAIVFNSTVKLTRYRQLRRMEFDDDEAAGLLTLIKLLIHDNINPLVGLCCNNPSNELLVLWKYCSRGTLSDYLHNSEMRMDANFKTAFLRDIINGLNYLHNSPLGYHGALTSSKCVIDANFIVKIVAVGVEDLLGEWRRNGFIVDTTSEDASEDKEPNSPGVIKADFEIMETKSTFQLDPDDTLYRAPELLRNGPPTRVRLLRMAKPDQLRYKDKLRRADIYSLSMIMYEVLFRKRPFEGSTNLPEGAIIAVLKNERSDPLRPVFPSVLGREHHPVILDMIKTCWSENPIYRPHIRRVKKLVSIIYKMTGGLVTSVIQLLDQHAHSLERQVRERTRMLQEAQMRADRLLAQMLPKDIAYDLKMGRAVVPRIFDSASVLFTDIVSFTRICSQSTPVEIINFLNDLFTGYDAIISRMDAFKVETIGDAYMVVSGVPKENGTEHAKIIAQIALKMRKYLLAYEMPHMPEHKMRARWGMHTGSVAAGVVGLTAPRYCLFGDTVNMASRMESTGEPERIQISSELHGLIMARKDRFAMEKRGLIGVKGKGECVTYWLLDEGPPPDDSATHNQ